MIDHYFRALLPQYTRWLVVLYKTLRLTPNQITVVGLVIACVAAMLVAMGLSVAAILAWWLGRLLDGTDGIYARATGQTSDFGGYLDIVCDMAAYSVMILGFMWLHPAYGFWWAIVLLLYVLCITSALALGALETKYQRGADQQRSLRLAAGLAEGGETGIIYTIFLALPAQLPITLAVWTFVLGLTVVARSFMARELLR